MYNNMNTGCGCNNCCDCNDNSSAIREAFKRGYRAGVKAGYCEGKKAGLREGYCEGKKVGYAEGKKVGYAKGFKDGKASYEDDLDNGCIAHRHSIPSTPCIPENRISKSCNRYEDDGECNCNSY